MVLARVLLVEQAPQNGCFQCLHPQGKPQLSPVSLGGSLRWASRSDPGFFQATGSMLGLRTCVILHAPFKRGVSISLSHPALPYTSRAGLQNQMFWGLSSWCSPPRLGSLVCVLDPLFLGEKLHNYYYPPIYGSPTRECGSWLYCFSAPPICLIVVPSLYL